MINRPESLGPYGGGNPSPSPEGSTGLSVPTQSSSAPTGVGATNATGVPTAFEQMVVTKLQNMVGTRGYLLDSSALTAIADKLWQSVSLQQLYAGYLNSPSQFASNLEAQIMNTVLNPSMDPTIDPTIMSDYATSVQNAGLTLTPAMLTALGNATMAANAAVPKPFGTSTVSGNDYGTQVDPNSPSGGYGNIHRGVDYGTPAGSRIVSPFAGTYKIVSGDKYYGNRVSITLDNGWVLSFGHVASGSLQDGARVNPGDLIAVSGANVGDSQGAVTLVEWQSPQDVKNGTFSNPHEVMDPIFSGSTFANLGVPGAAGTGMPSVNTILDREYPSIKADWTALFGTPPSPGDVNNVLAHGSSPTEWRDFIRAQEGHITGMNVGQIYDLRNLVDSTSLSLLGHAGTDGIVKELHDQGMTGTNQVKLWYGEHSPNELDSATYNQIYAANAPVYKNILLETGFDPRIAKHQAAQAAQGDQVDPNWKGPQ